MNALTPKPLDSEIKMVVETSLTSILHFDEDDNLLVCNSPLSNEVYEVEIIMFSPSKRFVKVEYLNETREWKSCDSLFVVEKIEYDE